MVSESFQSPPLNIGAEAVRFWVNEFRPYLLNPSSDKKVHKIKNEALYYSYNSYFMTFLVRPIIRPQRIFAKMMRVGGRGGGGPKFVYPEMAQT